jgi:hypothetical protein
MRGMRRSVVWLACGVLLGADALYAAEESPQAGQMPAVGAADLVTVTATVEGLDLDKRTVTLKGPEGNVETLKVGKEVRNLPQVHVGDQVVVNYYQAVALAVTKPGQAAPGATVTQAAARAKPGEKPAGGVVTQVTLTATVEAMNKEASTVTLKGADGTMHTLKVRDPKVFADVKVGDEVTATYTDALAITVQPPASK